MGRVIPSFPIFIIWKFETLSYRSETYSSWVFTLRPPTHYILTKHGLCYHSKCYTISVSVLLQLNCCAIIAWIAELVNSSLFSEVLEADSPVRRPQWAWYVVRAIDSSSWMILLCHGMKDMLYRSSQELLDGNTNFIFTT